MSLATLLVTLRTLAQDSTTAKPIFGEDVGADPATPANGSNTHFRLKSVPVVSASVYITVVGTSYRTQSGFTVDLTTGIITFSVAPANGAQVLADYNYYWFSDTQLTEFLNTAAENLNLAQNPVDPTTVPTGLVPAMMQYALANVWKARASIYAERYSSSGGEAGQSVESVAKAYTELAKGSEKRGDTLRDAYYQSQGQQLKAAYSNPRTYPAPGFDPITPRR